MSVNWGMLFSIIIGIFAWLYERAWDWKMLFSTIIAIFAWFYQKAWDRSEERRIRYEAILINLSGFFERSKDYTLIKNVLDEQRRLWLTAPKSVIDAFCDFMISVDTNADEKYRKEMLIRMQCLVRAMRNDISIWSRIYQIIPRYKSKEIPWEKFIAITPSNDITS